jgi:hypothetical protein
MTVGNRHPEIQAEVLTTADQFCLTGHDAVPRFV